MFEFLYECRDVLVKRGLGELCDPGGSIPGSGNGPGRDALPAPPEARA